MAAGLGVLTLVALSFSPVLFGAPGLALALLLSGGAWYVYFTHYLPVASAAVLRARRLSQQLDNDRDAARRQYTLAIETLRQKRRPVPPPHPSPATASSTAAGI